MSRKLLMDTHVVLWVVAEPALLSSLASMAITRAEELYLSSASVWEIETKYRRGKLDLAQDLIGQWNELLKAQNFKPLPISLHHAALAGQFDMDHGDPFDRMLAAQAKIENLPLITKDEELQKFPIRTVW